MLRGDELILYKTQALDIPLLVLNFGLDIVDGVRGLNLEGDSFARKAIKMTLSVDIRRREIRRTSLQKSAWCGRFRLSNEVNGGVFNKSESW